MRHWRLALVLAALSAGCSSVQPRGASHPVKPVSSTDLARTAKKEIGRPYRYGGTDPKQGFDCSGLVWWSYRELGSSMPRSAREQFHTGVSVARESVRTGDLVFFRIAGSHPPDHVGIVTKPPLFVHAPSTGGKVRENSLDEAYWTRHFFGARRID